VRVVPAREGEAVGRPFSPSPEGEGGGEGRPEQAGHVRTTPARPRFRPIAFLVICAAAALLAGCASPPPQPPEPIDVNQFVASATASATASSTASPRAASATPQGTPSATGSVTITDFQVAPPSIVVPLGTRVTWTYRGSTVHRVVADTGGFDKGQVAPGASVVQVFVQAGTYPYHCAIHPAMHGTIVVQP
jgi:plastocyanin